MTSERGFNTFSCFMLLSQIWSRCNVSASERPDPAELLINDSKPLTSDGVLEANVMFPPAHHFRRISSTYIRFLRRITCYLSES